MNLDKYVDKLVTFQQDLDGPYIKNALLVKNGSQYFAGFNSAENPKAAEGYYLASRFRNTRYDRGWYLAREDTNEKDFYNLRLSTTTYGEIQ